MGLQLGHTGGCSLGTRGCSGLGLGAAHLEVAPQCLGLLGLSLELLACGLELLEARLCGAPLLARRLGRLGLEPLELGLVLLLLLLGARLRRLEGLALLGELRQRARALALAQRQLRAHLRRRRLRPLGARRRRGRRRLRVAQLRLRTRNGAAQPLAQARGGALLPRRLRCLGRRRRLGEALLLVAPLALEIGQGLAQPRRLLPLGLRLLGGRLRLRARLLQLQLQRLLPRHRRARLGARGACRLGCLLLLLLLRACPGRLESLVTRPRRLEILQLAPQIAQLAELVARRLGVGRGACGCGEGAGSWVGERGHGEYCGQGAYGG